MVGRANTVWLPPLLTVAEVAEPPADTTSAPPLLIVVNSAGPSTVWLPPLPTVAEVAEPPAETTSTPPLLIVAKFVTPPEETISTPPLSSSPIIVPALKTVPAVSRTPNPVVGLAAIEP